MEISEGGVEVDGDSFSGYLEPEPWNADAIRKIRNIPPDIGVISPSGQLFQRVYRFENAFSGSSSLAIRRLQGVKPHFRATDYIWLNAYTDHEGELTIGVSSSYLYERTGCLINSSMLGSEQHEWMPFLDIVKAVLNELETLLGLQIESFCESDPDLSQDPNDQLLMDYQGSTALLVFSDPAMLNHLENGAKNYCSDYWEKFEWLGTKVAFRFRISLMPRKRIWALHEIAELAPGDLIALNLGATESGYKEVRAILRFETEQLNRKQYEVYLQMDEDETRIQFESDSPAESFNLQDAQQEHIAAHEQIELEVYAGKTKITFNELCSVQKGTLIELREHALPKVTLRVMGVPIFEAELVHFQEQLMLQVLKKLE